MGFAVFVLSEQLAKKDVFIICVPASYLAKTDFDKYNFGSYRAI